mgnify:CR=1 FL=1
MKKYERIWRNMMEIWRNFSKSQVLEGSLEFFQAPGIWRNVKKYEGNMNMKKYKENMKKHEGYVKKYEGIMKE